MQKLYKINIEGEEYTVGYPASVLVGQLEEELETLRAERDMLKLCADQNEDEVKKMHAELKEAVSTVCTLRAEIDWLSFHGAKIGWDQDAIEILRKVFDLYESGADCYDSDDHYSAAYLGKCIRLDDDLFKSCVDLLSASQPAQQIPEGYALVPIEPTIDMVMIGEKAADDQLTLRCSEEFNMPYPSEEKAELTSRTVYKAMLSASKSKGDV